jgi:hypothetical protein
MSPVRKRSEPTTDHRPLTTVREALQSYADRGIFRGFSEVRRGQFRFVWMLHHQMELVVDATTHVLRFKRLLPGLPPNSPQYTELKQFIQERHDRDLPEHRRIDRRRAEVSCFNRGGWVSISLKVKNNNYAYGVNRIVNLVHELFLHLRNAHPDYLVENFDVPQE